MQTGRGPCLKHILTIKLISSSWINNFSTFQSFAVKSTWREIVCYEIWAKYTFSLPYQNLWMKKSFQNWAEDFSRDFLRLVCGSHQCVNIRTDNTNWNLVAYFYGNSRWLREKSNTLPKTCLVWRAEHFGVQCESAKRNYVVFGVSRGKRGERVWYQFVYCVSYEPFFHSSLRYCPGVTYFHSMCRFTIDILRKKFEYWFL